MFFISKCKIEYFTKETFRILGISIFGLLIVTILVGLKFELLYDVKFLGQDLGYVKNRFEAEELVNEYLNNTTGNIAYIEIDEKPTYELKFVNKSESTDEKEKVLKAVEEASTVYYKIYGVTLDNEIIAYAETIEDSEQIIEEVKENDKNLEIGVLEIITDESKVISEESLRSNSELVTDSEGKEKYVIETAETIVSRVIADNEAKKLLELAVARSKNTTSRGSRTKVTTTTAEAPDVYVDIGSISFIKPAEGTITSRFGKRNSGTHTGVDIANKTGTTIMASASGTVTFVGWQGGYGNLVIISHGNGIQTYYAHCSKIDVTAGDTVSQGQKIAEVGSTGNSTGSHVHLEIRINGSPVNPENYI